jgi:hypothetical protein
MSIHISFSDNLRIEIFSVALRSLNIYAPSLASGRRGKYYCFNSLWACSKAAWTLSALRFNVVAMLA